MHAAEQCFLIGILPQQQRAHQVVVVVLEDAAEPCDANAAKVDDTRAAEKVDVGGRPAAMVQLPQVVAGLVVAANCMVVFQATVCLPNVPKTVG